MIRQPVRTQYIAHNAHAFVYVLEGSVVMQVRGGNPVTLTPGKTFDEDPDDVHVVGRNASDTRPAKFLVFLVKDKDAPVLVPANVTGEMAVMRNASRKELQTRLSSGTTRGGWLHSGGREQLDVLVEVGSEC